MDFLSPLQWEQTRWVGRLAFVNPFSEERTQVERHLLGKRHQGVYRVWNSVDGELSVNRNLPALDELCEALVQEGLSRWEKCAGGLSPDQLESWDLLCLYWLFSRHRRSMCANVYLGSRSESATASLYRGFRQDFQRTLQLPGRRQPTEYAPEEIFALFHQIHRAFNTIFDCIAGGTLAAANLRSSIWQSIFTYDLSRYYRQLRGRMSQVTTLVTGESGTGKELVARAIALSQYIPFDPVAESFAVEHCQCFHAVQLSAMPQTLVESALFGHSKGAFTGAVAERKGCFEACHPCGCIFLDEIGEVSQEIQVKLLRLLQTREFSRLGEETLRRFPGKVIAATNADLKEKCRQGAFRRDLLFRICSDTIETAPLRTLLDGQENELRQFVMVLSKRMLEGPAAEAFAKESSDWIIAHLGVDYPWPGNVRELEQCLRNLLIRGEYHPVHDTASSAPRESWESLLETLPWTAEELMARYVQALYRREGTLAAVARHTRLDPRTVKKYLGE
ncbi:MAG: sigma-54-dependent transcriptional regulator [Oligosphaeraceae bacterium]